MKYTKLLAWVLSLFVVSAYAQPNASFVLLSADEKITSETALNVETPLRLAAGLGEYVPFQVLLVTDAPEVAAPQIEISTDALSVRAYEQHFFPIVHSVESSIFSRMWLDAAAITDGLTPLQATLTQPYEGRYAVWVDVFVPPGAPAADYEVRVTWDGQTQSIPLTVYPVNIPQTGGVSLIVPLSVDWTLPTYSEYRGVDVGEYWQAVNTLLAEHYIISGSFAAQPQYIDGKWDFSALTPEIERIPVGSAFHMPPPFDESTDEFRILQADGTAYPVAAFNDPAFVAAAQAYFNDMRAYLDAIGRVEDAYLYPIDETFWVADEPDNNGAEGYERLAQWAQLIQPTGIKIVGSRVMPAPYAPDWLNGADLIDDSHVPVEYLDSAPQLYRAWQSQPNKSVSVYLNQYGDMIDLSALSHVGLFWHSYSRAARTVTGYAALEWVSERFTLVPDPLATPAEVYPQFGYGVGALIYPALTPSTRVKFLRDAVESTRLLDAYANVHGTDAARAFAGCLTHGNFSFQTPPSGIWSAAHEALLVALANNTPVDTALCLPAPTYADTLDVFNPATGDIDAWEFSDARAEIAAINSTSVMDIDFREGENSAFYWMGAQNWSGYNVLQLDVFNDSPAFAEIDVAIGDDPGAYLLLTGTSILIPPREQVTLSLPLVVPYGNDEPFDWSAVTYLEINVGTEITRRNGFGEVQTYPLGGKRLQFGNIRLAR